MAQGSSNPTSNLTKIKNTPVDVNKGNASAGTQRVVLANDSPTLSVNLSGGSGNLGNVNVNDVYAEDAASTTGDKLFVAGAVREDTLAVSTSATGDYTWLKTTDLGRLWTSTRVDTALPAGTNIVGKTYLTDGTRDATVKAGSTAALAADTSLVVALHPTSSVPTGSNTIGKVDLNTGTNTIGKVDVNTVYLEDDASTGSEKLYLSGAVRQDTLAATTSADNDYTFLKTTNLGRLWTSAVIDTALPAGTNNIGDVDIASAIPAGSNIIGKTYLTDGTRDATVKAGSTAPVAGDTSLVVAIHPTSSLPAGTNNIGDVDLASAIPAGTNTIGKVDVNQVYAEDVASAGGENLFLAGAIRQDSIATSTSADGDYSNLKVNSTGRLYTSTTLDTPLPVGSNIVGKTYITDGTRDVTVKAGNAAVAQADTALVVTIRDPISTNSSGTLGKLSANDGVDIGDVTINNTSLAVTQSGTWSISTVTSITTANLASDHSHAGNMVLADRMVMTGGYAQAAAPSPVADGKAARFWTTNTGALNIADAGGSITIDDGGGTNSITVDAPVATPVHVRLSDGTSAITALPITDNSGSLTVDAPVGTPVHVRLSDGTNAITALPITDNNSSITVDGTVAATQSGAWSVTANDPTLTISSLTITGTQGQLSCSASQLYIGQLITLAGAIPSGGQGTITGYANPTTYKISSTNGTSTLQIVNLDGSAITTTTGTGPTGLTATLILPTQVSNLSQLGGQNISMNTGTRDAGTQRVTIATNDVVASSQSGTWTVQPGNTANTTPWLVAFKPDSATATLNAINTSASILTNGYSSFNMLVTAATSPLMTLEVEVSANGTTWTSGAAWFISGTTVFGNQIVNPALNAAYQILVQPGYQNVRVRVAAYTSGSCAITLYNNTTSDSSAFPIFANQNGTAVPSPFVAMMGGFSGSAVTRISTTASGAVNINAGTLNATPTSVATAMNSNATTTAYATNLQIKNGLGNLYLLSGYNNSTSGQFIQVHNTTSLPGAGAVPAVTFYVAPKSNFSFDFGVYGRNFSNGIWVIRSQDGASLNVGAGAADCWFDAQFK